MAKKNAQIKKNIRMDTLKGIQKKKRNPRSRRARMPRQMSLSSADMYAYSVSHPFEHSGCIPDGAKGVGCFSVKQTVTLQTGGGSCYGIALCPRPYGMYYADTGSGGSLPNVTGNWSDANLITTLANLYKKYRPISAGIRMTYAGNTFNDQGTIVYGQYSGSRPLSDFNTAVQAQVAATSEYFKIKPLREGCEFTWRPNDEVDTANFNALATGSLNTSTTSGFPYLAAWVYGAAPATVSSVVCEIVINFEGQFGDQTFVPGGISTVTASQPAEAGWYEKATNLLSKIDPLEAGRAVHAVSSLLPGGYGSLLRAGYDAIAPSNQRMLTY